jgi:L-ribulose-5-phosphate 4-epimerase
VTYVGVKYRVVRLTEQLPHDARIEELRHWCRVFHAEGLAPHYPGGTHGNMSFRVASGSKAMIITAARSSFAEPLPDSAFFMVHDADLERMTLKVSGDPQREPSSEAMLHYAIYDRRPDVQAILHGHCAQITRQVDTLGIPVTRSAVESGTMLIVRSVMEVLDDHPFLEIRDHGFLAMAHTIEEAGFLAMQKLDMARSRQE